MRLSLSGRPVGLKIGDNGKKILTIEPVKEGIDIMSILPFHKHECDLHILGAKRDFNTHGYIDEVNIKNKLKLKFVCTDSADRIDLNDLNAIIDDPEMAHIYFDDKQATLTDYEFVKARQDKNRAEERKVMAEAQAFLNVEKGDTK